MSEMEKENDDLKRQVKSYAKKLKDVQTLRDEEKHRVDNLSSEMKNLQQLHSEVLIENASLKPEVQKGVEEMATTVNQGYSHCLERMSKVGLPAEGHSFEDFIRDYAASRPAGGDGTTDASES